VTDVATGADEGRLVGVFVCFGQAGRQVSVFRHPVVCSESPLRRPPSAIMSPENGSQEALPGAGKRALHTRAPTGRQ